METAEAIDFTSRHDGADLAFVVVDRVHHWERQALAPREGSLTRKATTMAPATGTTMIQIPQGKYA
jgi:hypothetical protein